MVRYSRTSLVTVKGQVVIPFPLRKKYGIRQGTPVCVVDRGREIGIQPLTKDYFFSIAGILPTKGKLAKKLLRDRKRDRAKENH